MCSLLLRAHPLILGREFRSPRWLESGSMGVFLIGFRGGSMKL